MRDLFQIGSADAKAARNQGSLAKPLGDTFGRPLRDLRISLTDRCNFRCKYCMPKEVFGADFAFLPHDQLLTFEEITRLASLFAKCGVEKIRLTGGEPLLRKEVEQLVGMLVRIDGIKDIALTTNGSVLTTEKAQALYSAGLKRVNISLDSLDNEVFMSMNDVHFPVAKVLDAIEAAIHVGMDPVKINMVVRKGMNEESVLGMAEYFRGTGCILRFIEFMDVGNTNGWRMDQVVSAKKIVDMIHAKWPLTPNEPNYRGEVANRYRYVDGQGEIGLIASVTQPFCSTCTRARLTPEGQLYTCLFASQGFDFRAMLRTGASDEEIAAEIGRIWGNRSDRYSEIRSEATQHQAKVEMSHIGG